MIENMIRLDGTSKKMDPMHLCSVFRVVRLGPWLHSMSTNSMAAAKLIEARHTNGLAVPGVTQVTEVSEVTAGTAWGIVSV